MAEPFIKRVGMWGLLQKPNNDKGRWSFIAMGSYIFSHEIDAYKAALKLANQDGAYIFRTVMVYLEVEIPEE